MIRFPLCPPCPLWFKLLLLFVVATPAVAQGRLTGVVVSNETGDPLPYSVISASGAGGAFFANDSGKFAIGNLPAGTVDLTVRRLGYVPSTLTVHVAADATENVVIRLSRIAIRLSAVDVRAHPPCTNPGAPRPQDDSTLANIFDQVRLNAEQFRLLSDSYPFVYLMDVWTSRKVKKNGQVVVDGMSKQLGQSKRPRSYKPGGLYFRRGGQWFFELPTLIELADPAFLGAHCFHFAGVENIEDSAFVRVDLVAHERIKDPDVDGSIYLDPASYQIRRTVLTLTKPLKAANLDAMEVTTDFREVLPTVSIIGHVYGSQTLRPNAKRQYDEAFEEQMLIKVEFLGAMPGKDALVRRSSPVP